MSEASGSDEPCDPKRGRHADAAVGFEDDDILIRASWGPTSEADAHGWSTNSHVGGRATNVWTANVIPIATAAVPGTTTSEPVAEV